MHVFTGLQVLAGAGRHEDTQVHSDLHQSLDDRNAVSVDMLNYEYPQGVPASPFFVMGTCSPILSPFFVLDFFFSCKRPPVWDSLLYL
jgi:hypothetical protein